jgi:hypothetical protein
VTAETHLGRYCHHRYCHCFLFVLTTDTGGEKQRKATTTPSVQGTRRRHVHPTVDHGVTGAMPSSLCYKFLVSWKAAGTMESSSTYATSSYRGFPKQKWKDWRRSATGKERTCCNDTAWSPSHHCCCCLKKTVDRKPAKGSFKTKQNSRYRRFVFRQEVESGEKRGQ